MNPYEWSDLEALIYDWAGRIVERRRTNKGAAQYAQPGSHPEAASSSGAAASAFSRPGASARKCALSEQAGKWNS